MPRENKYLREFLNLLTEEQVFHSYLTNSFMLNQMNLFLKELNEGKRTEEEIERDIQDLIKSIELMSPDLSGASEVKLTASEFCNLLRNVKNQSIQNLSERRTN